ncbi:MAG TPA: DUF2273 domain-containing protein [Bacillota bacterium]|nr:DUF2273 domain-containing protein [Bacillota bacterium]
MNSPFRNMLILYRGRLIGAIIGLVVALILVNYGLFKGFFILSLALIGYVIGTRFDGDDSLRELLERILPPVD